MRYDPNIPSELQVIVDREINSGERIQWIEKPAPHFFSPSAIGAFVFGIPWTAFAIFWICGASGFKIPDFNEGVDFFPLFGVPFVLVGLAFLSSPYWTYKKSCKTVYVITNNRAILIEGGKTSRIQSFYPADFHDIYRTENREGFGNVIFNSSNQQDSDGDKTTNEIGFMGIRNTKDVEMMLRSLAEQKN